MQRIQVVLRDIKFDNLPRAGSWSASMSGPSSMKRNEDESTHSRMGVLFAPMMIVFMAGTRRARTVAGCVVRRLETKSLATFYH